MFCWLRPYYFIKLTLLNAYILFKDYWWFFIPWISYWVSSYLSSLTDFFFLRRGSAFFLEHINSKKGCKFNSSTTSELVFLSLIISEIKVNAVCTFFSNCSSTEISIFQTIGKGCLMESEAIISPLSKVTNLR